MADNGTTAEMTAEQELTRSGGQAPPEALGSVPGGGGFTPEVFGPDAEETPKADEPKAPKATEEPPKPEEAKEEEEEPAKEEDEAEKPKWDKDRQAKDQELATLRKENAELKAKTAEPPPDAEDESPTDDDGPLEDKTEAELVASLKALTDESPTEDVIFNSNVQTKIAEVRALRDQNRRNRTAYNRLLADGDKEFGAEYHNEVVEKMTALWKSEGFGAKKPYPDAAHTRLAVRGFFAEAKAKKLEAAAAKPPAKPKAAEKPKPSVLDTGHGGEFGYDEAGAPEEGPASVGQIFDRMVKEGRVPFAGRRK